MKTVPTTTPPWEIARRGNVERDPYRQFPAFGEPPDLAFSWPPASASPNQGYIQEQAAVGFLVAAQAICRLVPAIEKLARGGAGVRIHPDTLYSRADLIEILEPMGINVNTFVSRLKPKKVFRMVYLGSDILDAFRNASVLGEDSDPEVVRSKARRGRGRKGSELIRLEDVLP